MATPSVKFIETFPRQRVKWYRFDPASAGIPDIGPIKDAIAALQTTCDALDARLRVLEGILLNIPPRRLIGRWEPSNGPAQLIQIGDCLDLDGDTLITTGCVGAEIVDGFTLRCVDDDTDHVIQFVLFQDTPNLEPVQTIGGDDPSYGKTLVCFETQTPHMIRLRLFQGKYNVEVEQAVGGGCAVPSILMRCVDDASLVRPLRIVRFQGSYIWTLS